MPTSVLMPTHEEWTQFLREFEKLTEQQQDEFILAMKQIVKDLRKRRDFHRRLRVKGVQGHPGVFEMTWAPDGRATFSYGAAFQEGEAHIIWRRIGSHDILKNP